MAEVPTSNRLKFGTELTLNAASFTGSPVSIGSLVEVPAIITFKNDSDQTVFVADNTGSTKGWTMVEGEKIIVDCTANKGASASHLSFVKGTVFYATAPAGAGAFRIGVLTPE